MSTGPTVWNRDATMRYLNALPLPVEFNWPHRDGGERPARPSHNMVIGYGKWLRETPYFPGLFELCHDLLDEAPDQLSPDWLPTQLEAERKKYQDETGAAGEHLAHKIRRLRVPSTQASLF